MSNPDNVKILQKILGDYTDFAHDYYLKSLEEFQKGFRLSFQVLMQDGSDFEFFFISFFQNHSLKFKLLNSSGFSHRDFADQIPIWADDLLKMEIFDKDTKILEHDFKFGNLDFNVINKAFNDDLVLLNPNIRYMCNITLLSPGKKRLLAIEELRTPVEEAQRLKQKIVSEFISLFRTNLNSSDENAKNNLHRLQLRLKFWGFTVDPSQLSSIQTRKTFERIIPSDFGLKDVYELNQFKKNILLPVDNDSLLMVIKDMGKKQQERLEKLLKDLREP